MIRGERFEVDLDDGDDDAQQATRLPAAFVGDILERQPTTAKPPSAPTLKSPNGFPEHRKRNVQSRFKQQKQQQPPESTTSQGPSDVEVSPQPALRDAGGDQKPTSWPDDEKRRIDEENNIKLASMSPDEIEEERRELMSSLSPAMIQRLLMRSNIASGSNETDLSREMGTETSNDDTTAALTHESERQPKRAAAAKTVTFAKPEPEPKSKETADPDAPNEQMTHDSVHFPRPAQPPDLDPSSATFLEDLHEKYFPLLPADPDKLEWMQASKSKDKDAYNPSAAAFSAKDIRFSFNGELIAPRTAAEIPVTAGLHHHGESPDAAGYTIAELAHLSHSTFAAQRCIAFQTLGRVLYRLGRGEFGNAGEPGEDTEAAKDTFGELARGLWRQVDSLEVIETLVRESDGRGIDHGKHVSAQAYATEALFLWQKGGGRRWAAE